MGTTEWWSQAEASLKCVASAAVAAHASTCAPKLRSDHRAQPSDRACCWTESIGRARRLFPRAPSLAALGVISHSERNKRSLSKLTIWETLATESFGSPVKRGEKPHIAWSLVPLEVARKCTQTTVAIRLQFSASPCTTTTGLRNSGPDSVGSRRSAHQMSP